MAETAPRLGPTGVGRAEPLRLGVLVVPAAAVTLLAGYVHLKLYLDGYRDIPVGNIGAQFLLNFVGAVGIAGGLVGAFLLRILPVWIGRLAELGGIVMAAVSLIAFFVARTSRGWFGFQDQPGLNPAPEAAIAVFSAAAAIVLGVALLAAGLVSRRRVQPA